MTRAALEGVFAVIVLGTALIRPAGSRMSAALGNLPEIHVWVGIVDSQEVVDFSTRHLKQAAQDLGMAWTAPDPPKYLWCSAKGIPDWVAQAVKLQGGRTSDSPRAEDRPP